MESTEMASESAKNRFFHSSVCKRIDSPSRLRTALRAGGKATFDDNKYWQEPFKMLKEANAHGKNVPIIFATDDDRDYAFGWAILTDVQLKGPKQYSFANLVVFRDKVHFDDLQKRDTGHGTKIKTRQTTSRPYNIINTPFHLLIDEPISPLTIDADSTPKTAASEAPVSASTLPSDATTHDGRFAEDLTATASKTNDEGYFFPGDLQDERKRWLREIVERRGQPDFRKKLIESYQGRCAVTGCNALAALEAAHIIPYCGPKSDHTSNGLLLRADIHALFDLDLIGIHPETLEVALGPELKNTSYRELEGKTLSVPTHTSSRPNTTALRERWCEFSKSE
jgi:hypothetical protein